MQPQKRERSETCGSNGTIIKIGECGHTCIGVPDNRMRRRHASPASAWFVKVAPFFNLRR